MLQLDPLHLPRHLLYHNMTILLDNLKFLQDSMPILHSQSCIFSCTLQKEKSAACAEECVKEVWEMHVCVCVRVSRVWAELSQSSVPWPWLRSVRPSVHTHTWKHTLFIDFYYFCLLALNLHTHTIHFTQMPCSRTDIDMHSSCVPPTVFLHDLMKYHMTNTEYYIHTQDHTLSSVPTSSLIAADQRDQGSRDTACRNIQYTQ